MVAPEQPVAPQRPDVTREMSATWSAIRSEIQQDSADLHREVLLWQRWVRYAVTALMTFGAIIMLQSRAVPPEGWVPVGIAAGLYLVVVILSAWYLKRSTGQKLIPGLTALVVVGDVAMITGMIMLSSPRDNEFAKLQSTPAALGGTTQSPYIVVPDADQVYRRAKGNGAEIVIDIKDEDYGGRGFSCRDPEGHLWNIGTYDPWRIKA